MAQESTKKTSTPDSQLKDGLVRPRSQVQVLFKNSRFYDHKPYHLTMVHPVMAEKFVAQGKAEYHEGGLSKSELKENDEWAKSKGFKNMAASDEVSEDEFDDIMSETPKGGKKK